jgi:predicted branched-subunit amino acid permease
VLEGRSRPPGATSRSSIPRSRLIIGLIAGFNKGRITAATVAASGGTAALVYLTAGPPWHVLAGALTGIAAAYLAARPEDA